VPRPGDHRQGTVGPEDAPALLVMRAARDRDGRCWLLVRLPSRPNNARGWVRADRVVPRPTRWRIVVSRRARTLAVFRDGNRLRRFRVVVGAPATPTPHGLVSIVGVWRWDPADFLGSYILPLTAHSDVLQEFGGGDGRVGIHGRGGASLLDPLGSARSHGCIRMSNRPITWIVRRVGSYGLPGIPVRVH
jgi:L,D-transpeptidase-like protein